MRQSIENLDEQFADLYRQSRDLITRLPRNLLYRGADEWEACGEDLLRSAAVVEQAFGGLTANLWDDPFEWTLPETLSTAEKVNEYLAEVEATRRQAFDSFQDDGELDKEIMTPSGRTQLLRFLLDTLQRARHHHHRALTICDRFRENRLATGH